MSPSFPIKVSFCFIISGSAENLFLPLSPWDLPIRSCVQKMAHDFKRFQTLEFRFAQARDFGALRDQGGTPSASDTHQIRIQSPIPGAVQWSGHTNSKSLHIRGFERTLEKLSANFWPLFQVGFWLGMVNLPKSVIHCVEHLNDFQFSQMFFFDGEGFFSKICNYLSTKTFM